MVHTMTSYKDNPRKRWILTFPFAMVYSYCKGLKAWIRQTDPGCQRKHLATWVGITR